MGLMDWIADKDEQAKAKNYAEKVQIKAMQKRRHEQERAEQKRREDERLAKLERKAEESELKQRIHNSRRGCTPSRRTPRISRPMPRLR